MHHRLAFALALLFAFPAAPADEPIPATLRALAYLGSAEGARASEDNRQIAFVTTLFGSRQAAAMPIDGGYPIQLTAEPGGVQAVRWSPTDSHALVAIALREGRHRLLLLDDQGGPAVELDPAPGDQLLGGFTRDGKRVFYALVEGGKVSVRQVGIDHARKVTEVTPGAIAQPAPGSPFPAASPAAADARGKAPAVPPPPTMAGARRSPPPGGGATTSGPAREPPVPLEEALQGVAAMGPVSPDGRSLLAQTRRGGDEAVWLVDLASARAETLTPHQGAARFRLPRWSPDGRTVYLLTDAGRDTLGVDAIVVGSRERKSVYAPGRAVEGFALTDDGHRLAVAEDANGQTVFSVLELPGLRAQPLPQPPGGALQPAPEGEPPLAWTRAGDRLLFAWRQAEDTTDVFSFRTGFGTTTRLTRSPRPGLPRSGLLRPSAVTLSGAEGRQVPGWIWRPRHPPRPRLALLVPGPEDPVRPVLDRNAAVLAAAGIAVLGLNPRGGLRPPPAQAAADDLAAALRSLRDRGDLDARKPLLVAVGAGAEVAEQLLEREPDAFSGVAAVDASRKPKGALEIDSSSPSALQELAKYARERLK